MDGEEESGGGEWMFSRAEDKPGSTSPRGRKVRVGDWGGDERGEESCR